MALRAPGVFVPALLFAAAYRTTRPSAPRTLLIAAMIRALAAAYETHMLHWSRTVVETRAALPDVDSLIRP